AGMAIARRRRRSIIAADTTWRRSMTPPKTPHGAPLSATPPGTRQLLSRIDVTASGERRPEPSLGEDPHALLIYDRGGNFAAQFMRRDRSVAVPGGPRGAHNQRGAAS